MSSHHHNLVSFSDENVQQSFEDLCFRNKAPSEFFNIIFVILCFLVIPQYFIALCYIEFVQEAVLNAFMLACICANLLNYILIIFPVHISAIASAYPIFSELTHMSRNDRVASSSMIAISIWAILTSLQSVLITPDRCQNYHFFKQYLLVGRNCTSMSVPISPDLMVILVIAPFYFMFALGESRYLRIVFFVVAVSAAMLSVVISHQVYFQIPSILFWTLISLITSFFFHQQRMNLFATQLKLDSLQQLEEKINQQSNAMRHLIGNVVHDLKTPLASFTSGIELINSISSSLNSKAKKGAVDSKTASHIVKSMDACIKNIRNTNTFMLMTIHRVLDYTKSQEGMKLIPKNETIDLLETLTLPLNCMRNIQDRVAIVLKPIVDPICSHIITDKQWLQENVLCLLSNAVKYSDSGCITIEMSLWDGYNKSQDQKENNLPTNTSSFLYLRIEIEDHGIGMTDEVMHGLFNQFQQAQRLAGGTGLGLYSLSKRVDAIQGKYGVQRRRDGEKGSLFWFAIPYKPDPMVADMIRLEKSFSVDRIGIYDDFNYDESFVTNHVGDANSTICTDSKQDIFSLPFSRSEDSHDEEVNHDDLFVSTADTSAYTSIATPIYTSLPGSPRSSSGKLSRASSTIHSDAISELKAESNEDERSKGMYILLVDDSAIIIKMSKTLLMRQGHQVMVAENGATAIRKLQDQWEQHGTGFDLVIMDLQMPVMDGLEAIKRWRAIESKGIMVQKETMTLGLATASLVSIPSPLMIHQPIIGMSANSDPETIQIALQAGFDAFIAKPFTMDIFQETVRKLPRKES